MRILIADDEIEFIEFIQGFIERKGHSVKSTVDGRRALSLIKEGTYDLVFLDHNMPGLTGLEVISFIKKNNIKTKTVMITGYQEMNNLLAKSMGADGYIDKPCRLEDIKKIIDTYDEDSGREE